MVIYIYTNITNRGCVHIGKLMSEFTPVNPITAFEILPGGEFVVVASSGSVHPTVLQLRGPGRKSNAVMNRDPYGDQAELEVDLSPDFQDDTTAGAR